MLSSSTMLNCGTLMVCVSAPYCFTMQMRFSHTDAYFTVISFCRNATILTGMSSTPAGSKDTAEMMCIMFVHMSHLLRHAYVRVPSYLRLTRCHSWPAIQLLFFSCSSLPGNPFCFRSFAKEQLTDDMLMCLIRSHWVEVLTNSLKAATCIYYICSYWTCPTPQRVKLMRFCLFHPTFVVV